MYDIIQTYKLYTCKLLKPIHLEKRVYVVGKLVSYVALSMRCLNMSNTIVKANVVSIIYTICIQTIINNFRNTKYLINYYFTTFE